MRLTFNIELYYVLAKLEKYIFTTKHEIGEWAGVIFPTLFSSSDSKAVQRSVLCRSRRELSDEYLLSLAKFGFDTAENEPSKVRSPIAVENPRMRKRPSKILKPASPWRTNPWASSLLFPSRYRCSLSLPASPPGPLAHGCTNRFSSFSLRLVVTITY